MANSDRSRRCWTNGRFCKADRRVALGFIWRLDYVPGLAVFITHKRLIRDYRESEAELIRTESSHPIFLLQAINEEGAEEKEEGREKAMSFQECL